MSPPVLEPASGALVGARSVLGPFWFLPPARYCCESFFPPQSRGDGFRRGQACFAFGLMTPCVGYACYIACCDDVRPWLLHWSIVVLGWLCVEFLSLLCTWPDDSVCWVCLLRCLLRRCEALVATFVDRRFGPVVCELALHLA